MCNRSVYIQVLNGAPNPRKAIYAEVLSRVREVMINHMAKPEEVLIEEDETGEIVRGENVVCGSGGACSKMVTIHCQYLWRFVWSSSTRKFTLCSVILGMHICRPSSPCVIWLAWPCRNDEGHGRDRYVQSDEGHAGVPHASGHQGECRKWERGRAVRYVYFFFVF